MNLYVARRTDVVGYDEHSAVVLRAESADDARALVMELVGSDELLGFVDTNFIIEPALSDGARGIVVSSFHAG